jgi:hypothetical protein
MAIWILSLMQLLVPRASYADSFARTADAIDKIAHEAPLYDGEDGVVETAVELVALTYHESRFDPHAVGGAGTSFGLAQIDSSNLHDLGLKLPDLFDPETNLRAAIKLMRISHRICRTHPKADSLANYAGGGTSCSMPMAIIASHQRMWLAASLLRKYPPRWVEPAASQ